MTEKLLGCKASTMEKVQHARVLILVSVNYLAYAHSLQPSLLADAIITGLEVIKLIPCSTQLSTKFILLINVKMPTIVGILTLISMINTTHEKLKARYFFMYQYMPGVVLDCIDS